MIFDPAAQTIIGSMGWVDGGALWTFDLRSQTEGRIAVEGSKFLSLRIGSNGLFRVVHHQSPYQTVSIRRVGDPALELASVRLDRERATFFGDLDLWRYVDPAVVMITESKQRLVLIDALHGRAVDLDLSWFNSANYDLGYQGLTDCISIDSIDCVIVSVQRSSKLMVVDTKRNECVGSFTLADRGGNPHLRMMSTRAEFLASDYDTLCRVDARSLSVLNSARLQDAEASNMRQFVGDYDFGPSTCVVARPFSSDVLLLDLDDFEVLDRSPISGQPLAVCMISESRVVTRDWKTGRPTLGHFSSRD